MTRLTGFYIAGPLTHTAKNGVTTLYGVVSGPATEPECQATARFTKVSHPDILTWIKKTIRKFAD